MSCIRLTKFELQNIICYKLLLLKLLSYYLCYIIYAVYYIQGVKTITMLKNKFLRSFFEQKVS